MMEGRELIRAEAMEHFMGHGVEIVRQTMLKQETIFKEQLRELHRLYNVQTLLMDEMKNSSTVSNRDTPFHFSANFIPIVLRGGGQSKDYSNGLSFERSSLKLKPGYDKGLQDSAHGDVINRKAHMDVPENPTTNVKASGQKATKRTFDLERLPEEYLDDEVHEETSTLKYRIEGQETESNKEKRCGDSQPDSMLFLSLKSCSREETNSTASMSPSQRNFIKFDVEHQSASKQSRYMEDECFPVSNISDQCLKPLAPSQHNLSGAKLEKSLDQEGRSSWNFDDACSDGSRKKGRVSLNLDTKDIPQEMRRISWESQGSLNRALSVQQKFIQEVHKNTHLPKQSELAGGSFVEGGQPWWKSFQSPKEVDMHSSGQMLGYFKTTAPSKTEGQTSFNATNYGSHPVQEKFDSAHRTTMPFQPWRESDLAASCLSTDIYAQGHGLVVSSGPYNESTILNSPGQISRPAHSMDSGMNSASGLGSPQEAITGLWYQPRTDFSHFPQLQQHQSISVQQTCPTSTQMQGSWQKSGLVGSNGMHSSLSAFIPKLKEPASLEFHAGGVRKSTEDLGINFWLTASGGPEFPTVSVSPPQLQAFSNPPKLVLDGATMQLKLASSDNIKDEEIVQTKAPGSLQVEHLDSVSKNMKEISTNSTDQNVGQCSDLGCKEALTVRTDVSEDGCLRSCKEMGSLIAQPENYSIRHARDDLSKEADQGESNAMKSYESNAGFNLELRSASLLLTDKSIAVTVSVSSGENLPSKVAMSVSENISTTEKASITYEGAEVSNIKDLIFLKTLRTDRQVLAAENVDSLSDVKQTDSHCKENSVERDDKITTNAVIVNGTNENCHHFESEVIKPLVAGERLATMQDPPTNVANPMCITTNEAKHKNDFQTVGSMILEVVKETELLQGVKISSLDADAKQQAGDVVEEQGLKAAENQIILESSTATEKLKKPQACATLESLIIQENINACPFSQSQCQGDSMLLSTVESLEPSRPGEDIAAGSTVTTLGDSSLSPKTGDPSNFCKGGSMLSTDLDLVAASENPKPPEVSKEKRMLLSTDEFDGTQAIVSHSSTFTSTTPMEAMSLLLESSTNGVANSDPDGRISLKSKHEYPPEKPSASNKLSPEETSECDQSLSLDESANLAASILVSLLPNASLPPKSFKKERACSALLKSSSSSSDHMLQLGIDQGKCKSYNYTQNFFSSPVVILKDDELCCTLQKSSLEQVAITETEGKFVQRQRPDFDSSSFNMKGHDNVSHEHVTNHLDISSSQKMAGASTTKKKLSKKTHQSKDLSSVSSLETPESRLGDTLEDVCYNKNLARQGSVAGCTSYTTFEGEGSNQVTGQQVAKPIGLEISDEDLCSPTSSQQVDSEDETLILPSGDTNFCIRNWGDSTRKKRMQRHKNPAFHKRQKSQRISLSKLQS